MIYRSVRTRRRGSKAGNWFFEGNLGWSVFRSSVYAVRGDYACILRKGSRDRQTWNRLPSPQRCSWLLLLLVPVMSSSYAQPRDGFIISLEGKEVLHCAGAREPRETPDNAKENFDQRSTLRTLRTRRALPNSITMTREVEFSWERILSSIRTEFLNENQKERVNIFQFYKTNFFDEFYNILLNYFFVLCPALHTFIERNWSNDLCHLRL